MATSTLTQGRVRRISATRRIRDLVRLSLLYVVLAVGALTFAVPFLWMLSTALKSNDQVFAQPPSFWPTPILAVNFVQAWTIAPFTLFFTNTLIIAGSAMLGTILTASLVGFSFARLRWAGRDFWFIVVLSTLMLPNAVTLVPTFILFKALGWVNTFAPLIVPFWLGGGAFNIFLFRQYFLSVPKELDEAATLDGASSFGSIRG